MVNLIKYNRHKCNVSNKNQSVKTTDNRTPFFLGGFIEVLVSSQTFTYLNQATVSFLNSVPLPFVYFVDFGAI